MLVVKEDVGFVGGGLHLELVLVCDVEQDEEGGTGGKRKGQLAEG